MEKHIIVRIFGGLGNQLFIYAFAKTLSIKNNANLILDSNSGFLKDVYNRKYKLDEFLLEENKSGLLVFLYIYFLKRIPLISKLLLRNCKYIHEDDSRKLQPELINYRLNSSVYLQGYWQSYKYFESYEIEIKDSLKFRKPLDSINQSWSDEISNVNSVAIHLRRIQYDHLLDMQYYLKSIDHIISNIENPAFYIFSDDMEFCKKNFKLDYPVKFVEHNQQNEIADFQLMTECKHFIIANSSFSWWAAWLAQFEDKIVVAPKDIHIGAINSFYPTSWIQL